ncbi:3761_t:CDS:2, partial [Paraglomus occultum]
MTYSKVKVSNKADVLKKTQERRKWGPKEDEWLRYYHNLYEGSWSKIAEKLKERDNRACYDRWTNHANPDVNKKPLEDWEIEILKKNHKKYGNKWSKVVKCLVGRTPLQAKNYFNAEKKKSFA